MTPPRAGPRIFALTSKQDLPNGPQGFSRPIQPYPTVNRISGANSSEIFFTLVVGVLISSRGCWNPCLRCWMIKAPRWIPGRSTPVLGLLQKKNKTMIPRYFQAVKITQSRVSKAFFVFPWKKIGSTQEKEKKMKVALYYF